MRKESRGADLGWSSERDRAGRLGTGEGGQRQAQPWAGAGGLQKWPEMAASNGMAGPGGGRFVRLDV